MKVSDLPWVAQILYHRLPARLKMGHAFDDGTLRWRPKEELHRYRLAHLNRYDCRQYVNLDIDRALNDREMAQLLASVLLPWSWTIRSLTSGHWHVAFLLLAPVYGTSGKVVDLLHDMHARLNQAFGGDPAHHGKGIMRNPFYVGDRQETRWGDEPPHALDVWPEWMEKTEAMLGIPAKPGLPLTGEGRNVDQFKGLGAVCRRIVGDYKREGVHPRVWTKLVLYLAEEANGELPEPLPHREVGHIATSVARHIWKGYDPYKQATTLEERQARRGRKSGKVRRQQQVDRNRTIKRLRKQGMTIHAIAKATSCSKGTVKRTLGTVKRTLAARVRPPETLVRDPFSDDISPDAAIGSTALESARRMVRLAEAAVTILPRNREAWGRKKLEEAERKYEAAQERMAAEAIAMHARTPDSQWMRWCNERGMDTVTDWVRGRHGVIVEGELHMWTRTLPRAA